MQSQPLLHSLEINFWNLFYLLIGRSQLVRRLVVEAYSLVIPQTPRKTMGQIFWLVAAGLVIGFVFAIVQAL